MGGGGGGLGTLTGAQPTKVQKVVLLKELSPTKYDRRERVPVVLELVPFTGEKHFKPRPQNWIAASLRFFFSTFPSGTPRPFLYRRLPSVGFLPFNPHFFGS